MYLQDTHDIQTGALLRDTRGFQWICVGATSVPQGTSFVFVREVTGLSGTGKIKDRMWTKTFSQRLPFEDMFVDADSYLK